VWVFPHLELGEAHFQRIVQQHPADHRLTDAQQQLDRFCRLHRPNRPRQNTEYAPSRSLARGRVAVAGEHAAVARPFFGVKHAQIGLQGGKCCRIHRLAQLHAGVIYQIARRKVLSVRQ